MVIQVPTKAGRKSNAREVAESKDSNDTDRTKLGGATNAISYM